MLSLLDKLWNAHVVSQLSGDSELIAIDRIFLHERTGASALNSLAAASRPVIDPGRVFAVMDHIVDTHLGRTDQTLMPGGQAFITETRSAAKAAGIRMFDIGDPEQGIVHVISPELGIVLPGTTLVAPDSHTCTQGAFGALAWGVGSTDVEHAMATGTLRLSRPGSMRIRVNGKLAQGVTAKDLVLSIIARLGAGGGKGQAIEFIGDAITALDMEGRMTLCNMATEMAAMTGFIAPDDITFAYLSGRRYAPEGKAWNTAVATWKTLYSDPDARFDSEEQFDARLIAPMISWGTSPQSVVAIDRLVPAGAQQKVLDYMQLQIGQSIAGTPIDGAFIGSCTNARLSDLRRAAALIRGRKVSSSVKAICVPGSSAVKRAAEAEGLNVVFDRAGFEWRESGCSMCFYAGGESFPAGARVISSTNRNFESRQGPNVKTHIASPETVVASAIAGVISDPRDAY